MAKNHIKTLSISSYRSIQEMSDLELRTGLNVLIGGNGAGKSNFISFFQMLADMMDPNLGLQNHIAKCGGADAILFRGSEFTQETKAQITFDRNSYQFTLALADSGKMYFSNETATFKGPIYGLSTYGIQSGHSESQFADEKSLDRAGEKWILEAIRAWRVYHFHNTSKTAPMMLPVNVVDNAHLSNNASNIAAFLLHLKEENIEHYNRILTHIKLAAPFFGDFELKANKEGKVQLLWKEKYSHKIYYPHQLSDGTLRFICLATLLLQPSPPATIIIDEPELGLHPSAITVLAGMLKLAEDCSQLVISTQSSPLVDHLDIEDLLIADRIEGATTFKKLSQTQFEDWLEEYSLGELWDKNLLGGMPNL